MSSYMEHIAKKPRLSSRIDDSSTDSTAVRANKIIKLRFLESLRPVKYSSNEPEFTHQLFKDEEIDFLDADGEYGISVFVNTCDLSHCVVYSDSITSIDRQLLVQNLQNGVPDGTLHLPVTSVKSKSIFDKFECSPPGKLIKSFCVKGSIYDMYLATAADEGAAQLLARGEKIAMWFIETADSVDFEDSRWEVMFLFKRMSGDPQNKDSSPSFSVTHTPSHLFVGYFTLFTFHNPFQGSKLRICQALVLPTHQGLGLGRLMMLHVYEMVRAREAVTEITVEDPCPGFQVMRDNVDFEWCVQRYRETHNCADSKVTTSRSPGSITETSPSSDKTNKEAAACDKAATGSADIAAMLGLWKSATDLGKEVKIIKAQATFVLEALAYLQIVNLHKAKTKKALESSAEFKEFRLKIKRRLFKGDAELKLLSTSEMQDELVKMFDTELKRYESIVRVATRLGLC